ncbi:MAG: hypothetical protein IH855_13800 [Bacteroidetes bacterium]|nr:hypothetical protein [Bacteroidota bacterium]
MTRFLRWDPLDVMDHYVTFVASIFRSIRFGTSSSHGRANLIRFSFFREIGAIEATEDGRWRIVPEKMAEAVDALSR